MRSGSEADCLYLPTCLGILEFRGDGMAITSLCPVEAAPKAVCPPPDYLREAARQTEAYLAGQLRALTFPIRPQGTAFQQKVWEGLQQIPYGETESYGILARRIGHPGAARAVGTAAGKNPILLAIPCHRLVAAHGLGGFSAGLWRKELLLSLEAGEK